MSENVIPPTPSKTDYRDNESYKKMAKANETPIFDRDDPLALFGEWMAEARVSEPNDANAMAVATVDGDGLPDVRMVLLKGVDARGFVFYSHKNSAKGQQLRENSKAALNFHWKSLRRQVRIRGDVTMVSKIEVGDYFSSRARDSQIGAWASQQSQFMEGRGIFEKAMAELRAKFEGVSVPLPPGWKGWRVVPRQIEFWRDKPFRLHDRLEFRRDVASGDEVASGEKYGEWTKRRLYP
ncbi:MAG: pyridoxamine 5'-phosphate oxidase [Robiginitomaculum sp.]|nr:MAG: pyridoxamine 5'-phosphate oxidase [Robiginitomaculum sp.]